ncbi:conserved hypothetical protein [Leishmania major strain Friedlin]|uniref:Uncharacterized protein n=1 Tax=Leishmania major TaxID=5664 RepID=Q4Q151_LEIMA|nr:conserved hypothetical protein [Leishmania major strain Friedlin]CAG9583908.1 Protein_of_unknown_function_(DUF1619)_-_putative [Leishmania major strain Friedlin]CAJ09330.1 conserved hypothetical protein [Leishmania major strain Friedlin]|eukprot:XP_001686947.1 conserved hypothetical protein [Leishmania major strain Friedlin]
MLQGLLCLLLLTTSAFAYPIVVVPVDWANVPNSTPEARNLNSPYLGECVCDVTRGICDPFCCCDEDCDASARAAFSYCLPEKYSSPYLDYCYPKDRATSLKRINRKDATFIEKKLQGYNAVCVIRTNHPSELYRYFRVPTDVRQPLLPTAPIQPVTVSQPYAVGDPLTTAKYVVVSGSPSYRRVAPLQLPTTMSDGSCSALGRNVGFLDSIKGTSCTLNGAQICLLFPLAKYQNLFLQATLGYNSSAPEFVPVTLNLHDSSGALLNSLGPTVVPASSTYATISDGKTCNNAIVDLHAHFSYSSNKSGKLIEAALNVTLRNVGLTQYVALSFEAAFTSENVALPNNIFAATPGYLPGDKIRSGTLITHGGKSTILERKSGFAVPAGGRLCGSNQWRRASFLHSIISSGCLVLMSESDLQDVCSAGTGRLLAGLINVTVDGEPTILDQIGVTNDALTNDTTSWIAISGLSNALTSPSGTYNAYTRQCSNITVGLHYQFVVARAGAEYNPQDIIVGAFASPIIGTLQIWNETNFDENALSYQQFTFKVSFSRYDPNSQATIMRRVVAPPILPPLDDSIFYPFRRSHPV